MTQSICATIIEVFTEIEHTITSNQVSLSNSIELKIYDLITFFAIFIGVVQLDSLGIQNYLTRNVEANDFFKILLVS